MLPISSQNPFLKIFVAAVSGILLNNKTEESTSFKHTRTSLYRGLWSQTVGNVVIYVGRENKWIY